MSHPVHLILSPGTRVVTRNDANRIGGGQPIAAGTVAVITDSPADAQHAYKVRFNDGAEAMLRRTEFSILKEFKADEAVGRDAAPASSDFEFWKPFIIYRCVVGSQAFGLSADESDVDRHGIYLPPAELHWSLYGVPEQIENNETQEAYWELQKFLVMALKANPNILECLRTPPVEHATPLPQELLGARQRFLSKLIAAFLVESCRSQALDGRPRLRQNRTEPILCYPKKFLSRMAIPSTHTSPSKRDKKRRNFWRGATRETKSFLCRGHQNPARQRCATEFLVQKRALSECT